MEKSIQELIQDLNDDDEFVQEEAFGLLEIRSEESLEPLIEVLSTKGTTKNVKEFSARLLGVIGDEKAIDPLIATLRDNNKLVRREASTALSRMGDNAVEPLINILDDDDWRVRGAAAWALGKIGDKRAIEPLKNLLDDESGFVRTGAKFAVDSIENT
ncbi:HEAT repeat domain-containing protein [Methanobrevibacter sp. TMH8]|uniref:HEAT repeat domain-containing protein n=1 Tax=Methanobrevibacter sp. TMH8 TaxID=2848611 RepID=UPI001CCA2DA1|nr:HEAT repeat domain-containing protein [Methanobrevibacter sp. TMH8]MBZ9570720.1 HEAT repeat domain-containing protein [Methanobrevibacter sp. TMH8]